MSSKAFTRKALKPTNDNEIERKAILIGFKDLELQEEFEGRQALTLIIGFVGPIFQRKRWDVPNCKRDFQYGFYKNRRWDGARVGKDPRSTEAFWTRKEIRLRAK